MRFLVIVITALGLLGCQPSAYDKMHTAGLIYCSEGSPSTFNPQLDTSGTVIDATSYQIYDRLLDINPGNQLFVPALATSWQVSDDNLSYTFELRKGVKFQSTDYFRPTREFNADDVLFSFNRVISPDHPYHKVGGGEYPFFSSINFARNISQIKKIGTHGVIFTLKIPDSTFLSNLATHFAIILSAEYGSQLLEEDHPEQIDSHPVGTGPFFFSQYQVDSYIKFRRHTDYWKNTPELKKLVYDITPQGTVRLAKLLTSECDVMSFPHASDMELIQNHADLNVQSQTGANVGFLAFNTRHEPMDDLRVRKAIELAIDQQAIIESVYYNTATRAKGLLPPSSWAHNDELTYTNHDPVRARQLLAEAGLAEGFSFELWIMPIQRSYNPNAMKMGQIIQESLSEVGIRVKLITHEWHVFRRNLELGMHDAVLIGWTADNADPDNFFRPLLSCQGMEAATNRANWCNPGFDRLLDQARATTDMTKRKRLYDQAQSLISAEKPVLPIAHGQLIQVHRSEITGLVTQPFGGIDFSGVTRE